MRSTKNVRGIVSREEDALRTVENMPAASSDLARSISSPGSPYNAAMPRELVWIDQPHIHGWDAYNVRGLQPSGSAYRPPPANPNLENSPAAPFTLLLNLTHHLR